MDQLSLIYCPCPDHKQAQQLAKDLLASHLVACVNITKSIDSSYLWQGQLEHAEEVILLAKTLERHRERVETLITELHPYDCPCILQLAVSGVNQAYKDWVIEQCTA